MLIFLILNFFTIDSILNNPELNSAYVGVYFIKLANDSVIYARNENKVFTPGSNMKLLTTAASLYYLGTDFRYKTKLAIKGNINEGTLYGDILLIGGGDPLFSFKDLEQFVAKIKGLNIRKINGSIVVDDTYFTDERLPFGWSWHYLDACYAPEISALSLNKNCVKVRIRGIGVGKDADVEILPQTDYVKLVNNMKTKDGPDSIIIFRRPEANIIHLDGAIGKGHIKEIDVAVKEPALFTGEIFKERLINENIKISGSVVRRIIKDTISSLGVNDFYSIDSIMSPPLIEIIKETNTESENLYAEILLKTLGATKYKEGSFPAGIRVMKEFLFLCGADTSRVYLTDGSGLSRYNLISPYSIVSVLKFMYKSSQFFPFYSTLPRPGEGTLKSRFGGFKDTLRAKTGALSTVSALSGYLKVNGEDYCFSMLFNNFTCSIKKVRSIQEAIINALVDYIEGGK